MNTICTVSSSRLVSASVRSMATEYTQSLIPTRNHPCILLVHWAIFFVSGLKSSPDHRLQVQLMHCVSILPEPTECVRTVTQHSTAHATMMLREVSPIALLLWLLLYARWGHATPLTGREVVSL